MLNYTTIEERINNEFHAGYVYMNMQDKKLAKEKIESGIEFYFSLIDDKSNDMSR